MVDKKIVDQVVKALLNQNGGNKGTTRLYGTAVVNNGQKFVRLDGSDQLTTVVEGTEIIDGDRVLVSIEDHQAVVLSNVTSPASARTATSFMDFVNDDTIDGLIIGEIAGSDGSPPQSIVIGTIKENGVEIDQGIYLRVGTDIIAKFTGTEFGDSQIILGPFSAIGDSDEYTVVLDNLGLAVYKNFVDFDTFDSETRIRPGWIGINEEMAGGTVISSNINAGGSVSANQAVYSTYRGALSLGSCTVPVTYTSSGTTMMFTIPMPYRITSTLSSLSFNCAIRCGGHYLIQASPSTHAAMAISTGTTVRPYVYDGSTDVQLNAVLTASNQPTGILCTITFSSIDALSNGLNNNAAVAQLSNITATFT